MLVQSVRHQSVGHLYYTYTDHLAAYTFVDEDAFRDLKLGLALNPVIISLGTNPKKVQGKTLTREASLNIYCLATINNSHNKHSRNIYAMCGFSVTVGNGETLRWTFLPSSFLLLADNHRLWARL